jgi:dissimilatory sulfite reductase (desulfoviridin) alpha/beta subunit
VDYEQPEYRLLKRGEIVSGIDYNALKRGGFMRQVQKEYFSLRLRVAGGQVEAEHLLKLYDVAQKFGRGYIHLTSRQSIEIPFIKLADTERIKHELAAAGIQTGASGPRVRTITACQGNAVCPGGLIDTTLAKELDDKYYGRELPHKFKIGITGCHNNCLKAEENDLGIKGGFKPERISSACSFCGLCEAACPSRAIQVQKQTGKLIFDVQDCTYCGRCAKSCPAGAWQGTSVYLVYFGGLFGNRIAIGKQLLPIPCSKDTLYAVIETVLVFFARYGKSGERFGNMLDRVGWTQLQRELTQIV